MLQSLLLSDNCLNMEQVNRMLEEIRGLESRMGRRFFGSNFDPLTMTSAFALDVPYALSVTTFLNPNINS